MVEKKCQVPMSVTFVTAFVRTSTRDPTEYLHYFERLASTGIDLLLFLDESLRSEGESILTTYPNVRIPEYVTLPAISTDTVLPIHRTVEKDTAEYLTVQCLKLEWMSRALAYTTRPYLAWVDFRIFHVFKTPEQSSKRLRDIEHAPPSTSRILAPGCWSASTYNIWDSIVWRFCGGFLLGPRERFREACERQTQLIADGYPRLTWEVNYWTRMEDIFEWYRGNHDDTILPIENGQTHPSE